MACNCTTYSIAALMAEVCSPMTTTDYVLCMIFTNLTTPHQS